MERLKSLTNILEEIFESYKEYKEIAEKKNGALVGVEFSRMNEFLNEEERIATKIGKLELKRLELFDSISMEEGVSTLKEVIDKHSNRPESKRLNELRDKLLALTSEVDEINQRNLELTKKSLDMVDFTLQTITDLSASSGGVTYNNHGGNHNSFAGNPGISLLDLKV
jgi:flagellar biosynthesis/type III secretory pathway chaperone